MIYLARQIIGWFIPISAMPKDERDRRSERLTVGALILIGLSLIALSVIALSHEVVASIFAFTGAATTIFGVLLPRLEGRFEISPTKLVATLRAVGTREDLTFDDLANELLKLLGISGSSPSSGGRADGSGSGAHSGNQRVRTEPLPFPLEFVVTGETGSAGVMAQAFERYADELFQRAGWTTLNQSPTGPDRGVDFEAIRGSEKALVTVLMRRRLSLADVRRLIGLFVTVDPENSQRHIVVMNAGAPTATARQELDKFPQIEILEIPVVGW